MVALNSSTSRFHFSITFFTKLDAKIEIEIRGKRAPAVIVPKPICRTLAAG